MSFSSDITSQIPSKLEVGRKFDPTDEQLVGHYLMQKLQGYDYTFPELKVCEYEPRKLLDLLKKKLNDQVGYFFSPRDYKYSGSLRFNRRTKGGFWKATGKSPKVICKLTKKVIATKRYLVFYKNGDPKPIKTRFTMHEYDTISKGKFLLYKLMAKLEESDHMASPPDFESPNLSPVPNNSSWDKNEDFDAGNQSNENEAIIDRENLDTNEMATMSTSENGKFHCLTWDFAGQNPHQEIDISASVEGKWSPIGPSPSDKSTSSNFDNVAEVDPLSDYINWSELEEWLQGDGEGSCNSAIHQVPISPEESCSCSSSGVTGPIDE